MTRILKAVIFVALLLGGVQLFLHWQERSEARKAQEAALNISPSSLPGLPAGLEASLEQAQKGGAKGLRNWLRQYGSRVQDPRLAWIQLDYVVLVSKDNTAEAKRVFAEVKKRIGPNSPVYPRLQQLEPTYSSSPDTR